MNFWQFPLIVAAETSGGLFDIDATLPVMAIQFLLLVVVLNQLFFSPLTRAMDERNDYVRQQIALAQERLEKANALALAYEKELVAARKASQEKIATAQAEASQLRSQKIAEAMTAAQNRVAEARAEIERQKAEAEAELRKQTQALSQQILAKLLGNLVEV
jgi:F-type H+-transporting ATPase subunit b